jgi:hypothetical protein
MIIEVIPGHQSRLPSVFKSTACKATTFAKAVDRAVGCSAWDFALGERKFRRAVELEPQKAACRSRRARSASLRQRWHFRPRPHAPRRHGVPLSTPAATAATSSQPSGTPSSASPIKPSTRCNKSSPAIAAKSSASPSIPCSTNCTTTRVSALSCARSACPTPAPSTRSNPTTITPRYDVGLSGTSIRVQKSFRNPSLYHLTNSSTRFASGDCTINPAW